MITQSHIGEARANAQRFNDFNLNLKDNFRLQHILGKLSLIRDSFEKDIFAIILDLREGKRITEENLKDLIKSVELLDNTHLDNILEKREDIIYFLNNISENITELSSDINNVVSETKKLADAGF